MQVQIRVELKINKGAAANLEAKGYLIRKDHSADNRSKLLYATDKAENLRNSEATHEKNSMTGFGLNCPSKSAPSSAVH